jgi:hypothetical protein
MAWCVSSVALHSKSPGTVIDGLELSDCAETTSSFELPRLLPSKHDGGTGEGS